MPWTANLDTIQVYAPQPFMVQAVISYIHTVTNETIVDASYIGDSITSDMVSVQAQKRIAVLDARDASIAALTPGPITLPVPPTQEEIDAAAAADAFFVMYYDMNDMLVQVQKGLMKEDDPVLIAAQDTVKTELDKHPEYQKDPRFRTI